MAFDTAMTLPWASRATTWTSFGTPAILIVVSRPFQASRSHGNELRCARAGEHSPVGDVRRAVPDGVDSGLSMTRMVCGRDAARPARAPSPLMNRTVGEDDGPSWRWTASSLLRLRRPRLSMRRSMSTAMVDSSGKPGAGADSTGATRRSGNIPEHSRRGVPRHARVLHRHLVIAACRNIRCLPERQRPSPPSPRRLDVRLKPSRGCGRARARLPRAGAPEVQTAPLVAGRRARGAKDFEPVSLGDGGESCHVRVALGRRRQDAFEGGLADFSLESLELHRCEPD
jgi:hypothetical protein